MIRSNLTNRSSVVRASADCCGTTSGRLLERVVPHLGRSLLPDLWWRFARIADFSGRSVGAAFEPSIQWRQLIPTTIVATFNVDAS
jgi:hypothetical protein